MKKVLALITLLSIPMIAQAVRIQNNLPYEVEVQIKSFISGKKIYIMPFKIKPGEVRDQPDVSALSVKVDEYNFTHTFTDLTDQMQLVIDDLTIAQLKSLTDK